MINNSVSLNEISSQKQNILKSFGQNNHVSEVQNSSDTDSFEKKNIVQKNKLKIALAIISGTTAAAYAITRAQLGKIIKSIGEDVPRTLVNRIRKVGNHITKDGMTGLFNKSTLMTTIEKDFKKATSSNENLSVGMYDLDNFKLVNEIFDHKTGDFVLKRIATNLQNVANKHGARAYRYGGEEFVISASNVTPETAKNIADEVAEAIASDEQIQKFVPEFLERAVPKREFLSSEIHKLNVFFKELASNHTVKEPKKVASNLIDFIESYIKESEHSDTKVLSTIIQTLKESSEEELVNILNVSHKVTNETTLGNELDKIFKKYTSSKNDLDKWISTINQYGKLTISGGLANLNTSSQIKEGGWLVEIADAALKSAKDGGKNRIIVATDDAINNTIKNKAA